jgi:hypothetical protein
MSDPLGIGKAVEKLADPVVDIIKKVAGPAAEEIGLTIQDSVRVYRAKRQYRLLEKMREFIEEGGYEPKHVPLRFLLPAMDYASVEEDEDLHTAWAALLANAANPSIDRVPSSFVDVLRQLSPCDARLLDGICEFIVGEALPVEREHYLRSALIRRSTGLYKHEVFRTWDALGYSTTGSWPLSSAASQTELGKQRREAEAQCDVALDNLIRLRLVELREEITIPMPTLQDIQNGTDYAGQRVKHDVEQAFRVTAFGLHFVEMCTKPSARSG